MRDIKVRNLMNGVPKEIVLSVRQIPEARNERFACGVVLHDSADFVPFGDGIAAVQVSFLRV